MRAAQTGPTRIGDGARISITLAARPLLTSLGKATKNSDYWKFRQRGA